MARYECTLSPKLLEVAVNELHEPRDNAERLQAIDELRGSFNTEKYGPLIRDDDAFFLMFLRAKKFNQKKALDVLQRYHTTRAEFKEVFDKVRNPVVLQPIADKGVLTKLSGDTKNGSALLLYRPGKLRDLDIYATIAYSVLALEKVLEEEKYQIYGVATIEDMQDFNIGLFLNISPITLSKMTNIWQEAMPLRFKAVHMVNEGKLMDILMKVIKAFVKKKLLDRIHTHGTSYSAIQEYIDVQVLPPYLGGSGPDPDEAAKVWNDTLTEDWPQDTAL